MDDKYANGMEVSRDLVAGNEQEQRELHLHSEVERLKEALHHQEHLARLAVKAGAEESGRLRIELAHERIAARDREKYRHSLEAALHRATTINVDTFSAALAQACNGGKFADPMFFAPEHREFWNKAVRTALVAGRMQAADQAKPFPLPYGILEAVENAIWEAYQAHPACARKGVGIETLRGMAASGAAGTAAQLVDLLRQEALAAIAAAAPFISPPATMSGMEEIVRIIIRARWEAQSHEEELTDERLDRIRAMGAESDRNLGLARAAEQILELVGDWRGRAESLAQEAMELREMGLIARNEGARELAAMRGISEGKSIVIKGLEDRLAAASGLADAFGELVEETFLAIGSGRNADDEAWVPLGIVANAALEKWRRMRAGPVVPPAEGEPSPAA